MVLLAAGVVTGFISGFFGIGGGLVLVPLLVWYGLDIKSAISLSIIQMFFTSSYGSYLNFSQKNIPIHISLLFLGLGGFVGGLFSGFLMSFIKHAWLEYAFIVLIMVSMVKMMVSFPVFKRTSDHSSYRFFLIGVVIGLISMLLGIGGAIILVPILVGFMKYNLKEATSISLLFVLFASSAGILSLSVNQIILWDYATVIILGSLIGLYGGLQLKNRVLLKHYHQLHLLLYGIVLFIMVDNIGR